MAWKTRSGKMLKEGDRVVWCGWIHRAGEKVARLSPPDLRYQATVVEVLPNDDTDDGEIRVWWLDDAAIPEAACYSDPPRRGLAMPWLYPFCFELLEDVPVIDRLAELGRTSS